MSMYTQVFMHHYHNHAEAIKYFIPSQMLYMHKSALLLFTASLTPVLRIINNDDLPDLLYKVEYINHLIGLEEGQIQFN